MSDFLKYTASLAVLDKLDTQGNTIDRQNKALKEQGAALEEAQNKAGMEEAAWEFERRRRVELEEEVKQYKMLLSKPLHEIAAQNDNFRGAYEKQQEMLSNWVLSQRAFKELAMKYGALAGKTPEEIQAEGMAAKETILDGQSKFGNDLPEADQQILERKRAREEKQAQSK
ncbi:hypothetical protein [Ralstonia insidiosa]|uniref:Uncharacterized protein n=1 Tax=Ralstonia insidiosa TaxID=190721 RepID=A0A848P392_9RALS|nr:hypothetical protein [Ralstonia insidiosa]NMV41762.1 hypothetical protein [Ralstonia insidiosa]